MYLQNLQQALGKMRGDLKREDAESMTVRKKLMPEDPKERPMVWAVYEANLDGLARTLFDPYSYVKSHVRFETLAFRARIYEVVTTLLRHVDKTFLDSITLDACLNFVSGVLGRRLRGATRIQPLSFITTTPWLLH